MPELEPITREEKLWSGEDIEPVTREEMYIKHIFDKTQTIPSKPITRKEMLLEKAGEGGGSDVTIKQLSVTENGTYSEENTAYSPVIVNVPAPPIPENAYLLNEVEGLPKDIATFSDGANLPMPSLKVSIEPTQSGSGDPSPTNVRPISGHTEANVVVSPTTDAEDGTTYTIQFKNGDNPLTVYGGTLDVVSGVLTVNSYGITITGTESFIYKNSNDASIYGLYVDSFPGRPYFSGDSASVMYRGVCSMFKKAYYLPSDQMKDHTIDSYGGGFGNTGLTGSWIRFKESSFADYTIEQAKAKLAEFYANGQPLQVVFPMVAQTIQLTPTQVNSLMGVNNIWADCGDIIDGQYFGKEV